MRKAVFEQRLAEIKTHNSLDKSWKEGVNHLTDRTETELKGLRGYKMSYTAATLEKKGGEPYVFKNLALPKEVDWRKAGVVSQVKDQGQCGSCWSFGTAESVESYWALATGQLAILSEQQVLDCTANPNQCGGTGGCGGGTVEVAFAGIIKQGGLSSEWTYPYQSYWGKNFATCGFNNTRTPVYAKLKSYVNLPVNKYEPILEAVAHEGPLAIAVDASAWSKYESGVFRWLQSNSSRYRSLRSIGRLWFRSQGWRLLVGTQQLDARLGRGRLHSHQASREAHLWCRSQPLGRPGL